MTTSAMILDVTDETFAEQIEKAPGLHMVDFWAVWCGPCRLIAPVVADLAAQYHDKGLHVAKLDVDANQKTTTRFRVMSIPSVLFFKGGALVDTVVGAQPKSVLEEKIKKHL